MNLKKSSQDNKYEKYTLDAFRQHLKEFFDATINQIYIAISFFVIPYTAVILYRIVNFGWSFYFLFVIFASLLYCFAIVFKKRLTYQMKTLILIYLTLAIVLNGVLYFGLTGVWQFEAIAAAIFAGVFLTKRRGYMIYALILIIMIVGAVLSYYGIVPINSTEKIVEQHLHKPSHWIAAILSAGLALWTLIYFLKSYQRFFIKSVEEATESEYLKSVIKELNETKEALAESEQQFREMFNQHSAVMMLIDPENGNILNANEAAIQYYGYDKDAFKNLNIQNINDSTREQLLSFLHGVMSEKVNQIDSTNILADGTKRNVEIYVKPITRLKQPMLFSIIHDITERKLVHEKLKP